MSVDSPQRWTDGQFDGFKEGPGQVLADYCVFQTNVKRFSTPEARIESAAAAWRDIQAWQPDLIYTSDDDALAHIGRLRNASSPPRVFSGANRSLTDHDLAQAPNLTGVLEEAHFAESVQRLRTLSDRVRRLAVISDAAQIGARASLRELAHRLKSGSANVSALLLSTLAAALEADAVAPVQARDWSARIPPLRAAFEQARSAFQSNEMGIQSGS